MCGVVRTNVLCGFFRAIMYGMSTDRVETSEPELRTLANGAIMDVSRGRIVSNPVRDRSYYSALARERWRVYREHAERAVGTRVKGKCASEAYAKMVGAQYDLALRAKDKNSTIAAQFVAKALDAMPTQSTRADAGAAMNIQVNEQGMVELSRALVAIARERAGTSG